MIDHHTVDVTGGSADTVGIALVGPPASGKSTVRDILGDMGVSTVDVSDAERPGTSTHPDWQVELLDAVEDVDESIPICCVEGLRDESEIEYFEAAIGRSVLVVRIDTHNDRDRVWRYIEQRVDMDQVVPEERIREIENQMRVVETEQRPYPDHHVSIYNDNSVRVTDLTRQLRGLVQALSVEDVADRFLEVDV